jgi:solute carrier family 50 protein (sugar transporter)
MNKYKCNPTTIIYTGTQIPNGIGTFLSCVQLVLYFCYYGSTPKGGDKSVELPVTAGDESKN